MFKKYKKLFNRIKSLEQYIGVSYCPADDEDGYNEHVKDNYGLESRLEKLEKK